MPDRGSVAMYEAVREVAGCGLDGCSGDGFGQRLSRVGAGEGVWGRSGSLVGGVRRLDGSPAAPGSPQNRDGPGCVVMASEWMVVLTGRYQSLDRCPDHVCYFGFERAHNDAPTSWGEFFALGIKPEEPPQLVDFPTRAHTPQPPYPRAGCPETPSLPNCPLSPSHGRVLRC